MQLQLAFKRKYRLQKFNLWVNDSEIVTWPDIANPNDNRKFRFHQEGFEFNGFVENVFSLTIHCSVARKYLIQNMP